ncbi:MAG TPA: hypothetical protein VF469_07875 [Kofleriaceae bacterium]
MPESTKSEDNRRTSKQESQREEASESPEDTEASDLKEREYRDSEGQIHHHTKKYMEQHEGEEGGGKTEE